MPRRIVLLSDGTGNSSASFWRTNVWRMFCSLDLSSDDQIACYDDGVGSSAFKPLAILGGATSLSFGDMLRNALLLPVKRHYRQPWLQPIARYSSIGSELDFLEHDPSPSVTDISEVVQPKVTGELFFYLNDAVVGIPRYQPFYGDNKGCVNFFIRPALP